MAALLHRKLNGTSIRRHGKDARYLTCIQVVGISAPAIVAEEKCGWWIAAERLSANRANLERTNKLHTQDGIKSRGPGMSFIINSFLYKIY